MIILSIHVELEIKDYNKIDGFFKFRLILVRTELKMRPNLMATLCATVI